MVVAVGEVGPDFGLPSWFLGRNRFKKPDPALCIGLFRLAIGCVESRPKPNRLSSPRKSRGPWTLGLVQAGGLGGVLKLLLHKSPLGERLCYPTHPASTTHSPWTYRDKGLLFRGRTITRKNTSEDTQKAEGKKEFKAWYGLTNKTCVNQ